jgi:hypothetical protein
MRTTQQNLNIVVTVRKVFFDVILGDESRTTSPTGRGVVEHVKDRESCRVDSGQLIQLGFEQNILWVDIRIDEVDFGFVRGVLKSSTDDLEHGGDSGSTSNHSELTSQIWGVDEFSLGAFDSEFVSNLEEGYMAGDVTLLIGLETIERHVGRTEVARTLINNSK